MTAITATSARPPARGVAVLTAIVVFSVLSTGAHFAHNFVAIEQYPRTPSIPDAATQIAILVSWPLLTATGLAGLRLYRRGRLAAARPCLAAYSALGIATLAHFLVGSPDIAAFWYATIFTDALAGFALLGFVVWSRWGDDSVREARVS